MNGVPHSGAHLAAVTAGEVPAVTAGKLTDRVTALSQLIDRIPADVPGHGERMHANTAGCEDTLGRMFEGHDVIAGSPEGQAFRPSRT